MPLSTALNGSTPTQLRGLAWLALSNTAQVGTPSVTDDVGGGGTTTWSYATAVPCRIDPLTSDESLAAGRLSDRSTHIVMLPANMAVTVASRVVIAGRGTFEVTAVQDRTGELARLVEVVSAA